MKKIILFSFLAVSIFGCKKSSDPSPSESAFSGKYSLSVKKGQVGNWGAMDILITLTQKDGKVNVNVVDDFVTPEDMGEGIVTGNTLTAKQHVESNFDTRDIVIKITNDGGFMKMVYDVDFTKASPDYHVEGVLTKQ